MVKKTFFLITKFLFYFFFKDIVLRNEFIQGCLRDELLRKILAPNTAVLSEDESTAPTETNTNT
jgi:hypothetical protein